MTSPRPSNLAPSELGTKEFWDSTYTSDLDDSPSADSELQGWFSDVNSSQKLLRYLSSSTLSLSKQTTSFLDLGTGNGEMLFLLREEGGFTGRMLGVDYSEQSVELCGRLASARGVDSRIDGGEGNRGIQFETWDIMRQPPGPEWEGGFDVVLDKGTFDAVSLNAETDAQGRRVFEGYAERVEVVVKRGGLLLVTSCNWTEEELKGWFQGGSLEAVGRVEYPVFSFGGQKGQSVCSVCFRRKG